MAAIYKVNAKDDVLVYYNRVPKKDGREPLLGWTIVATILFLIRAGGLLLFAGILLLLLVLQGGIDPELWSEVTPFQILIDLAIAVLLGAYIVSQFCKLTFSRKKKTVSKSFLFFGKHVAKFSEISGITAIEKEGKRATEHYYAVVWKKKGREPMPISPKVKNPDQLARYYHDIVPLLLDMSGLAPDGPDLDMDDSEEVPVEAVEVPTETAAAYLQR